MKKNTKKTIRIIMIVILVGLTILFFPILVWLYRGANFSPILPNSSEMKELVEIEKSLNIPKADYRKEDDRGCYTDGKGAQQFGREIYYTYNDKQDLITVIENLSTNGWRDKEGNIPEYDKEQKIWIYWYNNEYPNVRITVMSGVVGGDSHAMFIRNTNDEQCSANYPK